VVPASLQETGGARVVCERIGLAQFIFSVVGVDAIHTAEGV